MQIFLLLFTSTFLLLSLYFPSTIHQPPTDRPTLSRKKAHQNWQAIGNSASFAQINSLENFLATHRLLNSYP